VPVKSRVAQHMAFNPRQRDQLAVGYHDGQVRIYKLNYTLSNMKHNEINILNNLINEKSD